MTINKAIKMIQEMTDDQFLGFVERVCLATDWGLLDARSLPVDVKEAITRRLNRIALEQGVEPVTAARVN